MRILLFLLFLSKSIYCREPDTLLTTILASGNDTGKVNRLYQRGFKLRNSDPGLAMKYAALCERFALESGSPVHISKSYNLCGILSYKKGNYPEALRYHRMALAIREKNNDRQGIALSLTNMGNIYSDLKQFMKAERCYLKALPLYKETNDEGHTANCLINLGALKQAQGLETAAKEFYLAALKIGARLFDYEIRSICLNNLAIIFASQGDDVKAIGYNQDALKIRQLMDNNVEAADSYLNLASISIRQKNYPEAKDYLDTAYAISERYEYFEAMQEARRSYSDYFAAIGEPGLAYKWLKIYSNQRDSLLNISSIIESDDETPAVAVPVGIRNVWLLVTLFIFLIFVPLILAGFKR